MESMLVLLEQIKHAAAKTPIMGNGPLVEVRFA